MNRLLTGLLCAGACAVMQGCGGGDSMQGPAPAAAPRVTGLTNQAVSQDTSGTLNFQISDADSDVAQVMVSAQALDTSLVPHDGVVLSGSGATRTLRLTPAEDAKGTTQVVVRAVDPTGAYSEQSFLFTVNAVTASFRSSTSDSFAANEGDAPRAVSGMTFSPDADDDPAAFDALLQ